MTIKQARAIDNLMKTNGNVSKAMRLAGYSKATVNQPKVLTDSNAFHQWFKDRLTPDKLLKVHEEGLQATKIYSSPTEPDREVTDHDARYKFLALGYKVVGVDAQGNTSNTQINISFDGTGYIPPENVLNVKPTKK